MAEGLAQNMFCIILYVKIKSECLFLMLFALNKIFLYFLIDLACSDSKQSFSMLTAKHTSSSADHRQQCQWCLTEAWRLERQHPPLCNTPLASLQAPRLPRGAAEQWRCGCGWRGRWGGSSGACSSTARTASSRPLLSSADTASSPCWVPWAGWRAAPRPRCPTAASSWWWEEQRHPCCVFEFKKYLKFNYMLKFSKTW